VELEGVLAHELSHLKRGSTPLATVGVPVLGVPGAVLPPAAAARVRRWLVGEGEVVADLAAITITRYPPGLADALEVLRAGGGMVAAPPAIAHLWVAPPLGTVAPAPGEGLDERIATLREL
jgi:heat shock protein HtpX